MKRKLLLLLAVVTLGVVAYLTLGEYFSMDTLVRQEDQLRAALANHPLTIHAAAFGIFFAASLLPGSHGKTLIFGWLFGFWAGLIMVSLSTAMGAATAFLFSRYLLHDWISRKYGRRMQALNAAIQREGASYLFMLRMIPGVPFLPLNLALGLTSLRLRSFWWATQLGMLPQIGVFIYTGSRLPGLREIAEQGVASILTPGLVLALVLLGIVPLLARQMVSRLRRSGRAVHAPAKAE